MWCAEPAADRHNSAMTLVQIDEVRFNADGLVPAVAQAEGTGEVLMLAWMNRAALERTLASREATFWSRSRGELWVKGATSGARQFVHEVRLDCDGDALLLTVSQTGGACHTGDRTCFDARLLLERGE